MSNGDSLADSIRQDQDPTRLKPRSALADSIREELHPGQTKENAPPVSLAEELRRELRKSGPKPPQPDGGLIDRVVTGLIVEPLKDVSAAIKAMATTGELGLHERAPAFAHDFQSAMKREMQTAVLGEPTPEKEAQRQRALRGLALIGSFAGAPLISAVPAVGPLLGKWGSFAVGEFIGGGIYGGIRSLEDDESRSSAVIGDAATFAAFGLGIKGTTDVVIPWALKRFILRMPSAKRRVALGMAKAGLDRVESDLANGGVMLDQLPPDAKAQLEEPILREAVQNADPNAVDIDAIVKEEIDREVEVNSRLTPDRPTLKLPSHPVEDEFKAEVGKMKPIPGTKGRGFTAVGKETPPVPTEPTVTEILEGKKKQEQITGVAIKGKSGKVYPAAEGETTHPQIMARLMEKEGVPESEFIEESGRYSHKDVAGYKTTTQEFISKDAAAQAGLEGATVKEYIISPTVKGKSGKLYVGGSTHPETMERAIEGGVPKEEFNVPDKNRGFKTNIHDFVSRDYAAGLVGHGEPLISEDVHKRGLLPFESEAVADLNLETTVNESMKPGVTPPPEALMDAATDHAVAGMKPLDMSEQGVKDDAKIVAEEIHGIPKRSAKEAERIKEVMSAALDREGPAIEKSVLVGLTDPNPGEIKAERLEAKTPHEQNRNRAKIAKALKRERASIEIGAEEQVNAPWAEPSPEEITTIPKPMDGIEVAVNLNDKELNTLSDLLKNEKGQITASILARMTALGLGSWAEWEGLTDDRLSDGKRAVLTAVGTFLILASTYDRYMAAVAKPGLKKLEPMRKLVKNIITAYNPLKMMNDFPKGKEFFRQYIEMLMSWKQDAYDHGVALDKMFPDEASNRAAAFVLDEGRSAPEFHSLTPAQQQAAMHLNQYYLRTGAIGKAAGILDDYRENYVRHLLPAEAFDQWKTSGFRVLPTSGAFTKQRIYSLRELEKWAQNKGLPGPLTKLSTVHSYHMGEFSRALAGVRLRDALEGVGLVTDAPKSALTPLPEGWRPIKGVLNLPGKIAPDPIAKAIESISSPRSSRSELINSLDGVKSLWMRAIMFWWWEHGFNVARSWVNLSMNPADYINAYKFARGVDGLDSQIARYGGNLHDRPDRAAFATAKVRALFDGIGLPKLGGRAVKFMEWEDKLLWDKLIPSLQRFSYALNMHKWTERTGGKFLEGSTEFTLAARHAADFANTISGRIPDLLKEPELARGMRLVMFSPQWTMTRMSLLANAAGEAGEILAGRIGNKDPIYLKFKMRQLAMGAVLTYLGSKLMSGKAPQFNPQTSKFYMRTGLHDPNGREIGLDVIGWWQDDVRLFNKPFDFVYNRLNPSIKVAQEVISGRDYLGRAMTPGQRVGDILTSFGPLPEIASDAFRVAQAATGGRPIRGAEALQMGSRALATFRTSTLPRPMDAVVGKFAKKLLLKQGIPAADEDVYELSKLLRANLLAGKDMIDSRVIFYLANRRRGEVIKHPAATAIWQEARRVLADF